MYHRTISFIMLTALFFMPLQNIHAQVNGTRPADKPYVNSPVVAEGAVLHKISSGHAFTEGPVVDKAGNLYYTDQAYHVITKIASDGTSSAFVTDTGDANGLFFTPGGELITCLSGDRMVVSIDASGKYTIITDSYGGKRYNCCNDLWIDPQGGIYFTDPAYNIRLSVEQDGEHVYYIAPDRKTVKRVIDDFKRPNGIIGTPDGNTLYVTDEIARSVYKYAIKPDGMLTGKQLFVSDGMDGMTMDSAGNIYLAAAGIRIYSPEGKLLETIRIPENPTNVAFGGPDRKTLYITAQTSVYSIAMKIPGMY